MIPPIFYQEQIRAKAQARALRTAKVKEVAPGLRVAPVRVQAWLDGHRFLFPDERSDLTKYQHHRIFQAFIRKYGSRYMHDITAIECQAWALKHPLHVRFLRRAWDRAVQMQIVPLNVWKLVTMPRSSRAKPCAPSAEELALIVQRTQEREWPGFLHMIGVAAYTGARRGGLMGLRRSDVDLADERMTLTEKGKKTRTVVLAGPARDAMHEQFALRARHLWQVAGGLTDRSPLVFVNSEATKDHDRHKRLTADMVQSRWQAVRGDFPWGFHSLRHYAATWLDEQGVSREDIAVQLGHTDVQGRPNPRMAERVYVHPDPEIALERVARAFVREAVVV